MKRLSTVVLMVFVFVTFIAFPAVANKTDYLVGDFADIEEHWAYEQMSELIAMGILKGYKTVIYDNEIGGNTEVQLVKPYQNITRAEFAAILYQALNLEPVQETAYFTDTIPGWAQEAVNALYKEGIIKGNPDGTFRAKKNISRAEIATMLVNALNDKTQQKGRSFSDVPSWHWAYKNIQKASALGIINGLPDGRFAPDRNAQRAEVMVMLYQFLLNDKSKAPEDETILSRTDSLLEIMESEINDDGTVDFSKLEDYVTGEQELTLKDGEDLLNEMKQNGRVGYKVKYPGEVVRKSDRLAETVYETEASFKVDGEPEFDQSLTLREHFYLMKIGQQWYVYSNTIE